MTQAFPGQIPLLPTPFDGEDLAAAWNAFDTAYKSGQLGTTRPAGLAKGGRWTRENSDGSVEPMVYNGAADISMMSGRVVGVSTFSQPNLSGGGAGGTFVRGATGVSDNIGTMTDAVDYVPTQGGSNALLLGEYSFTIDNDGSGVVLSGFASTAVWDGSAFVEGLRQRHGIANEPNLGTDHRFYGSYTAMRWLTFADLTSGFWRVRVFGGPSGSTGAGHNIKMTSHHFAGIILEFAG